MSKQHSWPFPRIKPKFEGYSLPDEIVRLIALFAWPQHPLMKASLEDALSTRGLGMIMGIINGSFRLHPLRMGWYRGWDEEDPDDSFIANWFGTNVFVNLQVMFLFLCFLSNEGYQKILASKPPQPKGLV